MQLTMRMYRDDEDYWQIRQFLRTVSPYNKEWERNWEAYRFDYWRWHGQENIEHFRLQEVVFLWELPDGEIAAVLHPEGKGEAFLQVHPALHAPVLEEEMIARAEQHLATPTPEGRRELCVWANEHDALRRNILERRGYRKGDSPEYQRHRTLAAPIPEAPPPPGYTVRALGDADELPRRSWVSWRAFHPDEPNDRYQGWRWYENVQRAPLYRRDLDLVAVAPNGDFASFCTVWFDDVTRMGAFEPVGTAPEYQRQGLGKAVMCEGLRRLRRLGATRATVGSYSPRAHALYASAGFTEYTLSESWAKQI